MKNQSKLVILRVLWSVLFLMHFSNAAWAADVVDCKCEVLECGACESELDIKFYSEKCGENLTRMKSCKKSVCEPVANQDKCLADLGLPSKNTKHAEKLKTRERKPANESEAIGTIETVIGKAELQRLNQKSQLCFKGQQVNEDDRIITDSESRVKVVFTKTKDELHVNPDSNVNIQKFLHPNDQAEVAEKKKTIIKLDLGKIRVRISKATQKYDNEKNTFEVKTRTAVAGVRGTDFVMSYDEVSKTSDLQTLAGAVEMNAQNAGEATGHAILVSAGEACTTNVQADFSELSKVRKIDTKSLKLLDQSTEVKEVDLSSIKENMKSHNVEAENSICRSPAAEFKECAWFCEGNPKKEKDCRTDLKDVSCVRKMCGANGQWISPTRMPSSQSKQCNGRAPIKAPCGSHW